MKDIYNMLNNVKENLDNIEMVEFSKIEERKYMKNFKKNQENKKILSEKNIKAVSSIAACVAVCGILATTSYAKDIIKLIKEEFSISGVNIVVMDENADSIFANKTAALIAGRVYDENGKLYTREELDLENRPLVNTAIYNNAIKDMDRYSEEDKDLLKNSIKIYDKDGKEIYLLDYLDSNGKNVSIEEATNVKFIYEEEAMERISFGNDDTKYVTFKNEDDAKEYATFNLKMPTYIPDNYKLDRIEFLDLGEANDRDYAFIYYVNNENSDEYLFIHERKNTEDAGYETGATKVSEIIIQGEKAILTEDTVYAVLDGTICSVDGRNLISQNDIIKMAETLN